MVCKNKLGDLNMSFYQEVGKPFGLNIEQATQMEQGFHELEAKFHQAEDVNSKFFAESFYQQFEKLALSCGLQESEFEALINHLYFEDEFHNLVTFIIPSYYTAGGDEALYKDTYELMLSDLQLEQSAS